MMYVGNVVCMSIGVTQILPAIKTCVISQGKSMVRLADDVEGGRPY